MKSTDPADYQDTLRPIAGIAKESTRPPGCRVSGEQRQSYPDVPLLRRAGIGNRCSADQLQRDRGALPGLREPDSAVGSPMDR